MSVTGLYSKLHRAMLDVAKRKNLTPGDVRLIVAVYERGGSARTDDITTDLRCEGTMVRRSVCNVRGRYASVRGIDGGEARQGIRSVITLNGRGLTLAGEVLRLAS